MFVVPAILYINVAQGVFYCSFTRIFKAPADINPGNGF